jgi:hypothetical protein
MKWILITGILACATPAVAQENANQKAVEQAKTQALGGNFNFKTDPNNTVSVSYSFSPVAPSAEVNYSFYTPEPSPLSFAIKDASGKIVSEVKPTDNTDYKKGTLDVSKLKSGKYEYVIYWGTEVAHKVAFSKK